MGSFRNLSMSKGSGTTFHMTTTGSPCSFSDWVSTSLGWWHDNHCEQGECMKLQMVPLVLEGILLPRYRVRNWKDAQRKLVAILCCKEVYHSLPYTLYPWTLEEVETTVVQSVHHNVLHPQSLSLHNKDQKNPRKGLMICTLLQLPFLFNFFILLIEQFWKKRWNFVPVIQIPLNIKWQVI